MRFLPIIKESDGRRRDALLPTTEEEARALATKLEMPPGFLFGSATSAYQVEGGIEDVENDPFAPTMHGHLWKYAAPFLPEPQEQVLLERITHNAQPPKPPSSFLQKLSEQAPLTFPAAPSPPPRAPSSSRSPTTRGPRRSAARRSSTCWRLRRSCS